MSIRMWDRLAIVLVVGVALGLRTWGIGFGLPHTFTRPDEDAVFVIALRAFGRVLNPGFFHWPTLFMYTVAGGYVAYFNVGRWAGWFDSEYAFLAAAPTHSAPLYLIARGASAVAGVLTVWTVHRLGVRLFDRTVALTGAIFLAIATLHVRDSHFGVTDVAATSLLTLSFLFTVKYTQTGFRRQAVWSAVWAGLAASTKYNAALIALPALWVIGTGVMAPHRSSDRARLLALYCLIALGAFIAGTPYAVLDWRPFLTALLEVRDHLRAGHAAFAGPGWHVHLTSSLFYGLGWPMLGAGIAGLLLYSWRDRRAGVTFAIFPVIYFAVIGSGQTAFARYIIPIVPFLCLASAYFVVEAARALARWSSRPGLVSVYTCVLAVAVAAPPAWSSIRLDELLSRTDNRLIAADWIREHFPNGVTLYQTGSTYGHVQMHTAGIKGAERYRQMQFDEATGAFHSEDRKLTSWPDLIVVQESRLPYSGILPEVQEIVARRYELKQTFIAVDSSRPGLVYDQDDAFFLPLAGFEAVVRPGPNLAIHVRRGLANVPSSGAAAAVFPVPPSK